MRPPKTLAGAAVAAALALGTAATALPVGPAVAAVAVPATHAPTHQELRLASAAAFAQDVELLQSAAAAVTLEAMSSKALHHVPAYRSPAKRLYLAVAALLRKARREDPDLTPTNTTAVMGPVPQALVQGRSRTPAHRQIYPTHTLLRWNGREVAAQPSTGNGHNRSYAGSWPAIYRTPDGMYVDPQIPQVKAPSVAAVAVRAALREIGQPYVWAGGGPSVFDCSGLVQWAYAKAGIPLGHYTGYQWAEGRLVPPRDVLPGDLILFGNPTHHVGIYLGAGWMVNAPYTGQYVDVVPVESGVAGIIRP